MFLDLSNYAWSEEGCRPNPELSSASTTVCDCNHLTNFGIIFDFAGEADADDRALSIVTNLLLTLSCFAILATQLLLLLLK